MLATTYIQIVKTAILLFCGVDPRPASCWRSFGWNPLTLFQKAEAATNAANEADQGRPASPPAPRRWSRFRAGALKQWDQFSLILGVTLGCARVCPTS
jgi:Na+(H+)/acetate symporter ActP